MNAGGTGTGYTVLRIVLPVNCGLPDFDGYINRYVFIQEYAQVISIPVFPINKRWMMHQFNGELFDIHPEMLQKLESFSDGAKTPWWIYTGAVLLVPLFVGALVLVIVKAFGG